MNRRDTIIVAVLLNAAIIAVLLIMAVTTEEDLLYNHPSVNEIRSEANTQISSAPTVLVEVENNGFEEIFSECPSSSPEDFYLVDNDLGLVPEKSMESLVHEGPKDEPDVKAVEITVKKGDSLDKIARENGTTIEAIKQLNHLKSIKLSIGQKLQVPLSSKKPSVADKSAVDKPPEDAEYYTLKSGDTPWKIAKQQRISMEDILRLNKLNEEKARNLKVGDKIRIR